MAKFDEIQNATNKAWNSFEETLVHLLGDDFNSTTFYNIADSSIANVDDYVMQATSFTTNCPSCGHDLDNEDEINSDDTCWYCESSSDVSVV